jgi:hypothetical protein
MPPLINEPPTFERTRIVLTSYGKNRCSPYRIEDNGRSNVSDPLIEDQQNELYSAGRSEVI